MSPLSFIIYFSAIICTVSVQTLTGTVRFLSWPCPASILSASMACSLSLMMFVGYDVCRLIRFVGYEVCRRIWFVGYYVCRLIRFVGYDVCRLIRFVGYDVCRIIMFVTNYDACR